jgi:hypothetical protein
MSNTRPEHADVQMFAEINRALHCLGQAEWALGIHKTAELDRLLHTGPDVKALRASLLDVRAILLDLSIELQQRAGGLVDAS